MSRLCFRPIQSSPCKYDDKELDVVWTSRLEVCDVPFGSRTRTTCGESLGALLHRHRQRQRLLAGHWEMVNLVGVALHLGHELVIVRRLDGPTAVAAHSFHHW